jgi:hypothetical protein
VSQPDDCMMVLDEQTANGIGAGPAEV